MTSNALPKCCIIGAGMSGIVTAKKLTDRGIPFHLPVPASSSLTGFVMVEQVKSVDYNARQARFVEVAPLPLIEDAIAIVGVCLQ